MSPSLTTSFDAADPVRVVRALRAARHEIGVLRVGNPHHDAEGHFTSPEGEGVSHHPHGPHLERNRRRRLARRKRRLKRAHRDTKREIADLKRAHREERLEHVKGERQEHRERVQSHKAERRQLKRDQARERRELERDHQREQRRLHEDHRKAREHERTDKDALPEDHHRWEADRHQDKADLHAEHQQALKDLAEEHRQAHRDMRAEHKEAHADAKADRSSERKRLLQDHKEQRRETLDRIKEDLREDFPHRKSARQAKPQAPRDLANADPILADEVHSTMSHEWRRALPPREKADVEQYTGSRFTEVNSYLRHGTVPEGKNPETGESRLTRSQAASLASGMDRALKGVSLEESTVVYRGIGSLKDLGLNPKELVGATIHDKGFLSTSLTPKVADGFAQGKDSAIIRITAPKGSPGASVWGITMMPREREVLFARGSSLKITGAKKEGERYVLDCELSYGEQRGRFVLLVRMDESANPDPDRESRKFGWLAGDVEITTGSSGQRSGPVAPPHRFPHAKTAKASSAEDILRHCLKIRGWTREYRDATLTGRQHLELLDDVRQYGRAWLHHEALRLIREHGRPPDERGLAHDTAYHVRRFFARAKSFIRELIVAGALALAGPGALDADDLEQADQQAAVQHSYLDRFHAETIADPPAVLNQPGVGAGPEPGGGTTGPQFAARAEAFGASAWTASQAILRRAMIRSGRYAVERRLHIGRDKPCEVCTAEQARDWQPLGTLPPIGFGRDGQFSPCGQQCHCVLQYKTHDGTIHWIGGRVA